MINIGVITDAEARVLISCVNIAMGSSPGFLPGFLTYPSEGSSRDSTMVTFTDLKRILKGVPMNHVSMEEAIPIEKKSGENNAAFSEVLENYEELSITDAQMEEAYRKEKRHKEVTIVEQVGELKPLTILGTASKCFVDDAGNVFARIVGLGTALVFLENIGPKIPDPPPDSVYKKRY